MLEKLRKSALQNNLGLFMLKKKGLFFQKYGLFWSIWTPLRFCI